LKEILQVLPKDRKVNAVTLAKELYEGSFTSSQVRDLFFVIASQSEFYREAHQYGLTYVPQYGPEAGTIFHFVTAARSGNLSLPEFILDHTTLARSSSGSSELRQKLSDKLAFVCDELRHYSENSIGIAWCIIDRDRQSDALTFSVRDCAKFIEFMTKKFKLAHAIESLIELDNTPKSSAAEIDKQLVQSLAHAVSPDAVMIWRVNAFTGRLAVCAGTHNWNLKLDVGEGVAGKCALDQRIIVINDFKDHAELNAKGISSIRHNKFVDTLELRSGFFVPIVINNTSDSIVACYFKRPRGVTQTERDIIRFVDNNYTYYRTLFKAESSKLDSRDKIQKLAALMTFARDARSYVHDATALLNKADQRLSIWNPHSEAEKNARDIVGQALEEARKHLSVALTLTEPPKAVRAGSVLFETDEDISRHNIASIIRNVVEFYQAEAAANNIQIIPKMPETLRFSLSSSKFRRALSNIVDNAMYELKSRGGEKKTIEIEAQLLEEKVNSGKKRSELIILVRDNGPGIKKEIFENITEYFTTTKGDEGYGFGMAIVKDIMEAHGGQLLWRNQNRGAEFELRFPEAG
jgi:Histidine kinase-, DNA gyrase B-, and HSP90-like ATPase